MNRKVLLIVIGIISLIVLFLIPYFINLSNSPYAKRSNLKGALWQSNETVGYSAIPDTCQVWEDYFGHSYVSECTDTYGGRLIGNRPLSCKRNIFFVGDSLVWADGIEDTKTFVYLLQEKIGSKRNCVYNFAGSAYSFLQMYLKITGDIAGLFNPDDILIVGLSADSIMRDIYGPFGQGGNKPKYQFTDKGLKITGFIDTNQFNSLPVIRRLMNWISGKTKKASLTRLYSYLINDLIEFTKKHHIKLKIVILPFEREITTNKKHLAYRIIEENTPSQYLLNATEPLRIYREQGNELSLSGIYRVHYNYSTQQFLASFFEKALEDSF